MSTSTHAHTRHSARRGQQRAISQEHIDIALAHGRPSQSHGDTSYTLDDRTLQHTPYSRRADRLRGLTVVLTSDGKLRTVKWDYRIRRRPGILRARRPQGGALYCSRVNEKEVR